MCDAVHDAVQLRSAAGDRRDNGDLVGLFHGRIFLVWQVANVVFVQIDIDEGAQFAVRAEELIRKYEGKLREHQTYVQEKGIDPPEIANFQWE